MSKGGPSGLKSLFRKNRIVDEEKVEEEIISMVEEGHEQGVILTDEAEMISNIFEFGDKEVHDIMTSRQKILGIDMETSLSDALKEMLDAGFSRCPVYEEDLDNIIGVLNLKDAMSVFLENHETPVTEVMAEPHFVHTTLSIQKLFKRMQVKKIHMAIVLDEYGQTEGLVAMEDILEVIVGNIFDEYDEEDHDIIKIKGTKNYVVEGTTRLEDLNDLLGIEFPDEDIETLNGFLLYQIGHLPRKGEPIDITYKGYEFKGLKIDDRRVIKVKISPLLEDEEK